MDLLRFDAPRTRITSLPRLSEAWPRSASHVRSLRHSACSPAPTENHPHKPQQVCPGIASLGADGPLFRAILSPIAPRVFIAHQRFHHAPPVHWGARAIWKGIARSRRAYSTIGSILDIHWRALHRYLASMARIAESRMVARRDPCPHAFFAPLHADLAPCRRRRISGQTDPLLVDRQNRHT